MLVDDATRTDAATFDAIAAEWAARWPPLRTREQLVAEAEARASNISEL